MSGKQEGKIKQLRLFTDSTSPIQVMGIVKLPGTKREKERKEKRKKNE